MHAFLLIGNKISVEVKVEELSTSLQAKILEFPLLKIADARELTQFTRLKLTEKTAILIRDFDNASEETQNAFLKSLEEPQENLIFLITAANIESILPTIVSRCETIEISRDTEISEEDLGKVEEFINKDVGKKLKMILIIKNREEAIEFMTNLIIGGHKLFLANINLAKFVSEANKTLVNLKANGNVQLQLTNFVVNSVN
jgi:DNA polymerase III delta prime subunit